MPGIIIIVASIAGLLLIIVGLLFLFKRKKRSPINNIELNRTTLHISVPKESPGESREQWNNDRIDEAISLMEVFMQSIAGLKVEKSVLPGKKRDDHFSFEIAAINKEIFFYINCPKEFTEHIKQNIQASFHAAQVEIISDYNIFQPDGFNTAARLRLARSYALPLKTYTTLDGDPLNQITNALSKLEANEGAAIQLMVRSADKSWHKRGAKIAEEMHKGKNVKEAIAEAERSIAGKGAAALGKGLSESLRKKKDPYEPEPIKPVRQMTQQENEMVKGIEEKASKAGLDANLRFVVSTQSSARSESVLSNIINAYSQFNLYEYGNKLDVQKIKSPETLIDQYIFRKFSNRNKLLINTEEAASMFHFPLPSTETPNIHWLKSKKAAAPVDLPEEGLVVGKNVYRGKETLVRIGDADRRRHLYIIGMTGVGKSNLITGLAAQDIQNGKGVAVVDPHGDLVEDLLALVPPERKDDVIYFSPADIERPIGLNMLEADNVHEQDFTIQEMIQIFYKIVSDPSMIGPMFEHNMRNAMLTLMADKQDPGSITDIPRIFTDTQFQKYKLQNVTDPMVRAFWEQEMAKTSDFHKSEMLGYLISKVGRFVENQMMRNIIGQPRSGFNFKEVMNEGKILLVNLSKGQLGEVNSNLLGLIMVSKIQMAAMARAEMSETDRKDFFLYIDEFQNYTTDSISTILSEARKYRLGLTMAHQYLGQLVENGDSSIKDAVLGNVGSIMSFRIGVEDAETMARQFEPTFSEYDLVNVDKYHAFMRTLVNNAATRPFNIETLPAPEGNKQLAEEIKQMSRMKYGKDKAEVEAEINKRSALGKAPATPPPPPQSK